LGSGFDCPESLSATSVLYRSAVRGVGTDGCDILVGFVQTAASNNQIISVIDEELSLLTNCAFSVTSLSDEVICMEDDGLSLGIIIGAAVGGGVIVIIILILFVVLVVVLVVIIKKKREKKKIHSAQ
jgi:hypothetical protein